MMEDVLAELLKYGGVATGGATLYWILVRFLRKVHIPVVTIQIGRDGHPAQQDADNGNGNGKNGGNGNAKDGTEKISRIVLQSIIEHQNKCSPELHRKIEEYNKIVIDKIDSSQRETSRQLLDIKEDISDTRERVARIEGTQRA
jgi:hypothetical protein